jgi:hypothetical protein
MGYINSKIYWLKTFSVLFFITILHITLLGKDEMAGSTAFRLVLPFYQDNSVLPLVVLRCEKAKPIGIRVEMEGVTLDWIGDSIKDIKGVIKTPSAVYDKNTQKVTGNKKITYRSGAMDLDGVGFDIDQVKQIVHVRSKVKVVLKSKLQHERGMHRKRAVSKGKISLKKSAEKFLIERIEEDVPPPPKKVVEKEEAVSYDWSGWVWFIVLIIAVAIIVTLLNRRHKKRSSGKKSS